MVPFIENKPFFVLACLTPIPYIFSVRFPYAEMTSWLGRLGTPNSTPDLRAPSA
jgi:hypothetical protein